MRELSRRQRGPYETLGQTLINGHRDHIREALTQARRAVSGLRRRKKGNQVDPSRTLAIVPLLCLHTMDEHHDLERSSSPHLLRLPRYNKNPGISDGSRKSATRGAKIAVEPIVLECDRMTSLTMRPTNLTRSEAKRAFEGGALDPRKRRDVPRSGIRSSVRRGWCAPPRRDTVLSETRI